MDEIKQYKLSAHMIETLAYAPEDSILPSGNTRGGLIRRGLVVQMGRGRGGRLTELGREVAEKLQRRP